LEDNNKTNKPIKAPADHQLQKYKHPETYLQLQQIFSQYASDEMMAFCNHPYYMQTNEALNRAIANSAPKSVCYSSSISLLHHLHVSWSKKKQRR
jgi:hypothetical protein